MIKMNIILALTLLPAIMVNAMEFPTNDDQLPEYIDSTLSEQEKSEKNLIKAILRNDFEQVKELIEEKKISANSLVENFNDDFYNITPLMAALNALQPDIVDYLLNKGAQIIPAVENELLFIKGILEIQMKNVQEGCEIQYSYKDLNDTSTKLSNLTKIEELFKQAKLHTAHIAHSLDQSHDELPITDSLLDGKPETAADFITRIFKSLKIEELEKLAEKLMETQMPNLIELNEGMQEDTANATQIEQIRKKRTSKKVRRSSPLKGFHK